MRADTDRWGVFGGVYSNHVALTAVLDDIRSQGAAPICLGDVGAFGPRPDRACEVLRDAGVPVIQGNYDHSLGNGLDDCRCGYTDPRDNYFAALSYRYTFDHTSPANRAWMRGLPSYADVDFGGLRAHLCHGSPRRTNEFVWESTASDAFLGYLLDLVDADVLCVTHTGLPWSRALADGRYVINVGAIGRPANDGRTCVTYPLVAASHGRLEIEWRDVSYDTNRIAAEMRDEGLPEPFIETVESGWWTTCLEVLPAKERARGRY